MSIKNHLNIIPKTFRVDIPEDLSREIQKCKNNDEVRQLGIEWTSEQARELKAAHVPSIHFYTMGKSDNIKEIVKRVY